MAVAAGLGLVTMGDDNPAYFSGNTDRAENRVLKDTFRVDADSFTIPANGDTDGTVFVNNTGELRLVEDVFFGFEQEPVDGVNARILAFESVTNIQRYGPIEVEGFPFNANPAILLPDGWELRVEGFNFTNNSVDVTASARIRVP